MVWFLSFRDNAQSWLPANYRSILEYLKLDEAWSSLEWHPLGFIISKLSYETPFPIFRMHIWLPNDRRVFPRHPPIHSHARHMASWVLLGQYSDRLYELNNESVGNMVHAQRYLVEKSTIDGGADRLISTPGTYALRQIEARTVNAGGAHTIAAGTIHDTIIPSHQVCVTLVLKSSLITDDGKQLELVFGDPAFGNHVIRREPLSVETVSRCRALVFPYIDRMLTGR